MFCILIKDAKLCTSASFTEMNSLKALWGISVIYLHSVKPAV
jgi:hypothetical protein